MAKKLKKGLVHIYTGDGKGKTTAAFGLAIRAAGAGLRVSIHQFIKGCEYSENKIFRKIDNISIEQCGRGCWIKGKPTVKDRQCAQKGFEKACDHIYSGKYDVVVLDEANIALKLGLIKASEMEEVIRNRPLSVEIVLTGRHCPKSVLKHADLVTEMRKIKHPFDRGIPARKGIEF